MGIWVERERGCGEVTILDLLCYKLEATRGRCEGQGSLVCCSPQGHKDTTEQTEQEEDVPSKQLNDCLE